MSSRYAALRRRPSEYVSNKLLLYQYSIETNFGYNLFSLYDPYTTITPIFQIDANLAYPAVLLNALIQSPATSSLSSPIVITLLPALPSAWADSGLIKNARIRGGCGVSFGWHTGRLAGIVEVTCDRWVGDRRRSVEIWEGAPGSRLISKFDAHKGVVQRIWVD